MGQLITSLGYRHYVDDLVPNLLVINTCQSVMRPGLVSCPMVKSGCFGDEEGTFSLVYIYGLLWDETNKELDEHNQRMDVPTTILFICL